MTAAARVPLLPKPDPTLAWPIPLAGVELIADAEGLRLHAYRCPAGVWTIGWGQTEDVSPGMVWTKEQADADFCRSLTARTASVRDLCTRAPGGNELAALVSLSYNIGQGAFARSTALKRHNAGDTLSAARAFGLFNKARVGGQLAEMAGLTARRAAEAALYLQPDIGAPVQRMPQAVEPSSTLAASPIAQSGAVAAAAGAAGISAQASEHIGLFGGLAKQARELLDTMGMPPELVLPAVLLLIGAVVLWQRAKQRRLGWA